MHGMKASMFHLEPYFCQNNSDSSVNEATDEKLSVYDFLCPPCESFFSNFYWVSVLESDINYFVEHVPPAFFFLHKLLKFKKLGKLQFARDL